MALRLLFGLRIGPPRACFRMAFRPGRLAWEEGYAALERSIEATLIYLTALDREKRIAVLNGSTSPPSSLIPYLDERLGACDVYGGEFPNGTHDLVIRTSFRFPYLPLGEWVAFDGVHLAPDNSWRRYTEDEVGNPGESGATLVQWDGEAEEREHAPPRGGRSSMSMSR